MYHMIPSCLLIALVTAAVPEPRISSFTYTGNGCPRNTASYSTTPLDATANSIKLIQYFNELTPVYGISTPLRDGLKQCAPTIDIAIDPAYKVRVNNLGTSINGYVRLAYLGHDLRITANYTFAATASTRVSARMTAVCSSKEQEAEKNTQSISQSIVKGPWNGRFSISAPVVGDKVGIESNCGGGTLTANLKADISSRGESTGGGWVGNPAPSEDDWGFMTDVEVLPC